MGRRASGVTGAASRSLTSLAPNVAGKLDGCRPSSPVNVTTSEDAGGAAESFRRAFSSASLFLLLRRRSVAVFLALSLAFSILFSRLPKGGF